MAEHDAVYTSNVSPTSWSISAPEAFAQGYNNYDISYAPGAETYYKVTFDVNGGDETPAIPFQFIAPGELAEEPANPTHPDGETFVGWFTKDGTDGDWGEEWDFDRDTVNADITLYAKYVAVPDTFEVTYSAGEAGTNATGVPTDDNLYEAGETVDFAGTPSWPGHRFDGWKLNDTTQYDADDTSFTMPDQAAELVAQWTAYKVTFDPNNGDSETDVPAGDDGKVPVPATDPTAPTGGEFDGWYIDGDPDKPYDPTVPLTGDITVIALYKYGVTYTAGTGGSNVSDLPSDSDKYLPGTTVTVKSGTPKWAGHKFMGWKLGVNAAGGTFAMPDGPAELVAQWEAYKATFDPNNGDPEKDVPAGGNGTVVPPTNPTDPKGGEFDGWYEDGDPNKPFDPNKPLEDDTKFVAIYKYALTYSAGTNDPVSGMPAKTSDKFYADSKIQLAAAPARNGYVFAGWECSVNATVYNAANMYTMPEGPVTMTAKWNAIYTVTFDSNGATVPANPGSKQVIAPATTVGSLPSQPQRTGYTFDGWNTRADGTGSVFAASTSVTGDITVYAQWRPVSYTLSFNVNGGGSTAPPSQGLNYGALAAAVANPTRTNYVFTGWNTAANGSGTSWSFASTTMPGYDVTLYAQWRYVGTAQEELFTLSFNTQGGSPTPGSQRLAEGALAAAVGTPGRSGYVFDGWNTAEDGSGEIWLFSTSEMPDHDVTLYAQWSPALTPTGGTDPKGDDEEDVVDDGPDRGGLYSATIGNIPLIGGGGKSWALVNLILTIIGVIIAVILLVRYFTSRRDEDEEEDQEDQEKTKRMFTFRLIASIVAVVSVIVFILTENMRLPIALFDSWTILMFVLFVGEGALALLSRQHKDEGKHEQTQKSRSFAKK